MKQRKILVIKHGALGDLLHATGAFQALRRAFAKDHMTLLTDPRFAAFTKTLPFFDAQVHDDRSKNPLALMKIRRFLCRESFDWVFDLQMSTRSNLYHRLFWPQKPPLWSGGAKGCSHYMGPKNAAHEPVQQRLTRQLKAAGVLDPSAPLLKAHIPFLGGPAPLDIPQPYGVLVPGCSKKHPVKRWPVHYYEKVISFMRTAGYHPYILGGPDEQELMMALRKRYPDISSPRESLDFHAMASLGRDAAFVVGNDTGPTHLMAATGTPTVYCWSGASDWRVFAPKSPWIHVAGSKDLNDLLPETVWQTTMDLVQKYDSQKVTQG